MHIYLTLLFFFSDLSEFIYLVFKTPTVLEETKNSLTHFENVKILYYIIKMILVLCVLSKQFCR